jgi:ligand-binding sensor domain-containing protein
MARGLLLVSAEAEEKPSTERRNEMKSKLLFAAGSIAVAVVVIGILAISVEKREVVSGVEGSAPDYADAFAKIDSLSKLAESDALTDTAPTPELVRPSVHFDTVSVDYSHVNCTAVMDGKAVAGTDGGVFMYDPVDSSVELISVHKGLTDHHVLSILPVGDSLYIGTTTGLYLRDEYGLVSPVAPEFVAEITALASDGSDIYLGTTESGLVRVTGDETSVMLDKGNITAIQFGGGLMWAASDGEGLFYYDGIKWRRRYLVPDSTAFDHVSSLGYKFNRLYVGTPEGMYVHNGGSWDLYDSDDGLLVCDVTSISFMEWKILAGTRDWGYYEIFEAWVTPVAWSEALEVTSIASDKNLVVVGTPNNGIYVAEDKRLSNVNPGQDIMEIPVYASLIF